MKTNYFSLSGALSQANYFKTLAVLLLEFIIVTSALTFLLDIQNAEIPGAPTANQVASIVFLVLILLNVIVVYVAFLSAVLRRARDAGSAVLWIGLSLVLPFMFIILGFLPKNRN
ncbi:MAG: DUF805 domain-containing protein [Candidatus Saccharimonadales bacterium]